MRYLTSISLAVVVLMALACTATPATPVPESTDPAPNVDATVAAAVAATRTASNVQEKVAATLSAPHVNRGVEYAEAGHHEIAIQEYIEAIQLDPDDADAYLNRAIIYHALGQYERANADKMTACSLGNKYC